MFKKLLKYDMKAIWNVWWILAVSVLGASTVAAFLLRFVISNLESVGYVGVTMTFATSIAMLMLVLLFLGIYSSIFVTLVLVYFRFYKNFYTDEGYLTFTLPTSRKLLLLSKTVNALIWMALHVALYAVSIFLICLFAPPAYNGGFFNFVALQEIGSFFLHLWSAAGGWVIVYALEVLLLLVALGLFSISLIHFCITVGSIIAKKMKILAAIGIYYLVNMILSFVLEFVFLFGGISIVDGMMVLLADASLWVSRSAVAVVLLACCAVVATLACTFYCMTLSRLERKLNLA